MRRHWVLNAVGILFVQILVVVSLTSTGVAETKDERDARMKWWREARFGMFIHWGVYSVPAGIYKGERIKGVGEWIMNKAQIPVAEYEQFAARFNPVGFDADDWVRIAKSAGMKYIVITSKHHDGFCLWDSRVSDYDIMDASPFNRDILEELSEACRKQGIRLCFYYSIMDWHHPDAQAPHYPTYNTKEKKNPNFPRYVDRYLKPQLKELVNGYGPLGVLWFDGQWIPEWTEQDGIEMYKYVRSLQPSIIINNRVGKGRWGMAGLTEDSRFAGDFGTPEQRIPDSGLPGADWETCMTMNRTWGYKSYDDQWKSAETLLHNLIDIVSKGGNYLLNVGPTAEGLIPEPSVERLGTMGNWMKVNGESIYGTGPSPYPAPSWGRFTTKPGKLYVHVFQWPENGILRIAAENIGATRAYLLADQARNPLKVEKTRDALVVRVPATPPDRIASVVVIEHRQ